MDKGFVYVVPMQKESKVMLAVKEFVQVVSAPDAIICDHLQAQTSSRIRILCGEIVPTLQILEEGTPWVNRAKLYIELIKSAMNKDMKEINSSLVFWDYCLECHTRINNLTANNSFQLHGTTAYTQLTCEEGGTTPRSSLIARKYFGGYLDQLKGRAMKWLSELSKQMEESPLEEHADHLK
eukprot:7575706-Ditylum_brightwellii.AAC.1